MYGVEIAQGWADDIASTWEKAEIPSYEVDPQKTRHVAIICDGNRRAAYNMHLLPYLGHMAGVEVIKGIARAGRVWGIHTLTFWVWSTDNWRRDRKQSSFVMGLAKEHLSRADFRQELYEAGARFIHLGRKDRLPKDLLEVITDLERSTAHFQRHNLNLALDYGGKDEIDRAVRQLLLNGQDKSKGIGHFLDTAGQPSVDLVIRTGVDRNELPHTSGFMPLQTANSAWIFLPHLFPNLTPEKLLQTIKQFEGYEKRLGR